MKYTWVVFILWIISGCSIKKPFPVSRFEKPEVDAVKLNADSIFENNPAVNDTVLFQPAPSELQSLCGVREQFLAKDEKFSLEEFEKQWQNFRKIPDYDVFDSTSVQEWLAVTSLLLQLTGDEKYAGELEKTVFEVLPRLTGLTVRQKEKLIKPLIFMKNVDHIQVNLYIPSEIRYDHTLRGEVVIRQEMDKVSPGRINLYLKMEERRYVELFVRIPEWAEGTTVEVKKVKYLATPGTYCHIAKKWKDGDRVEIHFSAEKMPEYLPILN